MDNLLVRSIRVHMPDNNDRLIWKAYMLLMSRIAERSAIHFATSGPADLTIELALDPSIGADGFRIEEYADSGVRITGSNARGVIYGVGKFLRTSRYMAQGMQPSAWRGTSVPALAFRGIYFASHFFNWYHVASMADISRYIEDLALWGSNVLCVWFDMHHYTGIDTPEAQEMIGRLRGMLSAAKEFGMDTCMIHLANESYCDSPPALRADWRIRKNENTSLPHFHVELCPSQPGAAEILLAWTEEKLDAFADIGLDYLTIWPYDQGGCTCDACAPWGANGYLRMAEPIARAYHKRFPQGKVILSTWYFDHFTSGEWEGLDRAFNKRPDWADFLMVDDSGDTFPPYPLEHGAPGELPMINFPEISMYRMWPWGGYGANPLPRHLQALWDSVKDMVAGGHPYSEGCYEDLNKAIFAHLYWNPNSTAMEAVREYLAWEFSPDLVATLSRVVEILERNLPRRYIADDGSGLRIVMEQTEETEEALRLVEEADVVLPPHARNSWRWRIFYLRAVIDYELAQHDFYISDRCEEAFRELEALYHAERGIASVTPPTRTTQDNTLHLQDKTIDVVN